MSRSLRIVILATSRIPLFTEHFGNDDVAWCDPLDVTTITGAMIKAIRPEIRAPIPRTAGDLLAILSSDRSARLPVYQQLRELQHA
jgi:hypothetical protein